ncbi:MAG: DUF4868 domain-containing protein [Clostridia bacterium]|nr:DUF4868 domain-containing protein [Clostridia bacterium]
MSENALTQTTIKALLTDFHSNSNQCGLDVFVVMKNAPMLKRISLSEKTNNEGDTLRTVLKNMLFSVINDNYISEEAEYVDGTSLADDQHKFLIIPQSGDFVPFSFLNNTDAISPFSEDDLSNSAGLAFKLRKGEQIIWCYQHLWSIMVPNRKKNNIMARLNGFENQTVFEEQSESLLTIARKIDILIINDSLITANTSLLQNNFGFQTYIYQAAQQTITSIASTNLLSNTDKLTEYISRGKPKYAKKMMRIAASKVLSLDANELLHKIQTVERWKDKFCIDETTNKIVIKTYAEVERLIDLLDERYTRSDITDTEYDTDVKTIAQPVMA